MRRLQARGVRATAGGPRGTLALRTLCALLVVAQGRGAAVSDGTPPVSIWPLPESLSVNSACSANETLSLHGAQLSVQIRSGDQQAAGDYVRKAWRLAQQDWSVNSAAMAMTGASGPAVQVVVRDASCATPACYTTATNESYSLSISKQGGVQIEAQTLIGVSHAFSSLASLASADADVSCLPIQVVDRPRFPHRGLLLDTARNWFSVEDIKKKVIDPMHLTKMNVLKWHVYDSQSQPLEVRWWPALWQPYSRQQVYTVDQAKEVIDYAFHRGIRILPEFDMPGHTDIFAKADPSMVACSGFLPWDGLGWDVGTWCNQPPAGQIRPENVSVMTRLLEEWMEVFPNSVVSTGADEWNANCWAERIVPKNSSEYPQFWADSLEKLKAFQVEVAATVAGAQRQWAVYDESFVDWKLNGTDALPKGTILFVWEYEDQMPAMTAAGYDVVAMPYKHWYLDCGLGTKDKDNWCAPLKDWKNMYQYDPLANFTGRDPSRVLGGEAAMWSEMVRPVILDYILWPRAAAMAERLWSPADATKSAEAARPRLERLVAQLELRGLRPSPLDFPNFKYFLLPQWCDTAPPQPDSEGVDYCAPAKLYADVDLSVFDNLVGPI
ncbi:glycoside hydrolase family 20 isoform A [Chlorella sorokiniana]|uniref:Beta-hexosaminidase n=1 Tax=Chlorella sorokiniana TaxID=3076 RepID=A0A2P6TNF8_CHLSO|nr:glycoside hydrolase family 20 isoform A [Chlorella sorokiniana]|eukprot:PRW50867.1 glycoside hydrolase family 20 isoform A [Chlorella sorokiniana]